VHIALQFI